MPRNEPMRVVQTPQQKQSKGVGRRRGDAAEFVAPKQGERRNPIGELFRPAPLPAAAPAPAPVAAPIVPVVAPEPELEPEPAPPPVSTPEPQTGQVNFDLGNTGLTFAQIGELFRSAPVIMVSRGGQVVGQRNGGGWNNG